MKIRFFLLVLCLLFVSSPSWAKDQYLFRDIANWVKVNRAPSDIAVAGLKHPYRGVTSEQMEAMLLNIRINKRYALKNNLKSLDIFNSLEARRYSSAIVDALAQAASDEVVNFAVVHKRPAFILQNDFISIGNVFVANDGIHVQFTKLYAKITGDYETSAHINKALHRAKSMRLTLEAGPGQALSYDSATEIILNPEYDFINLVDEKRTEEKLAEEEDLQPGKTKAVKAERRADPERSVAAPSKPKADAGSIADRLRNLDRLKNEGLITESEYQQMRKKILAEL